MSNLDEFLKKKIILILIVHLFIVLCIIIIGIISSYKHQEMTLVNINTLNYYRLRWEKGWMICVVTFFVNQINRWYFY